MSLRPNAIASISARVAAIVLAAALVIGAAALYARASHPELRRLRADRNPAASEMLRRFRLRPRGPQLSRVGGFAGECLLLALIAAGGRYILRIRL
jgi:hypothetical protein